MKECHCRRWFCLMSPARRGNVQWLPILPIELSRSAAVVWLVRTPTFLRLKGRGNGERVAALEGVASSAGRRARLPDGRLRSGRDRYPFQRTVFCVVVKNERSFRHDPTTKT